MIEQYVFSRQTGSASDHGYLPVFSSFASYFAALCHARSSDPAGCFAVHRLLFLRVLRIVLLLLFYSRCIERTFMTTAKEPESFRSGSVFLLMVWYGSVHGSVCCSFAPCGVRFERC